MCKFFYFFMMVVIIIIGFSNSGQSVAPKIWNLNSPESEAAAEKILNLLLPDWSLLDYNPAKFRMINTARLAIAEAFFLQQITKPLGIQENLEKNLPSKYDPLIVLDKIGHQLTELSPELVSL